LLKLQQIPLSGAADSDELSVFFILDHDVVYEPVPHLAHDAHQVYPAASLMACLQLMYLLLEESVLIALMFDPGVTARKEELLFILEVARPIVGETVNGRLHHLVAAWPLYFGTEVIEQIEKMLMLVIHTFHTDTEFFIPDKDCHDTPPPIPGCFKLPISMCTAYANSTGAVTCRIYGIAAHRTEPALVSICTARKLKNVMEPREGLLKAASAYRMFLNSNFLLQTAFPSPSADAWTEIREP
jgi:hypothetical protein